MKKWIKATGLGLVILSSSMYANAAETAQKIGYVSTGQAMSELATRYNIQGKLQKEFSARIAALRSIQEQAKAKIEKLKRDGELMTPEQRTQIQRDLAALDSEYKLKANELAEDQRKRGMEEEQMLVGKIRTAIDSVAKKNGYTLVLDSQAVLFADKADDLSSKVISAVK